MSEWLNHFKIFMFTDLKLIEKKPAEERNIFLFNSFFRRKKKDKSSGISKLASASFHSEKKCNFKQKPLTEKARSTFRPTQM